MIMPGTMPLFHSNWRGCVVVHSVRVVPATAEDAVEQHRQQCCSDCQRTKHEINPQNGSHRTQGVYRRKFSASIAVDGPVASALRRQTAVLTDQISFLDLAFARHTMMFWSNEISVGEGMANQPHLSSSIFQLRV
jgi:hypothetical protein